MGSRKYPSFSDCYFKYNPSLPPLNEDGHICVMDHCHSVIDTEVDCLNEGPLVSLQMNSRPGFMTLSLPFSSERHGRSVLKMKNMGIQLSRVEMAAI